MATIAAKEHRNPRLSGTKLGFALVIVSTTSLSGCAFSASANFSSKGSSSSFQYSTRTSGPAVIYKEGRLDYRGVINFEYDKAAIKTDAETRNTLISLRDYLRRYPQVAIEVEGHTDSRGTDAYNMDLSGRRAQSVRQWLIAQGVDAGRITAVGKGESEPQVQEPPECQDQEPEDTSPCEGAWAVNRRVVFEVTEGAETLEAAEPEPEGAVAESDTVEECPWLVGGHANAFGPNSWITLAGAVQPGVCWLEPSLGIGIGGNSIDATGLPAGTTADASYVSLTVPLRARIWFMNRHSILGDLGLGMTRYWLDGEIGEGARVTEYSRNSTNFLGHAGLGYGFRPNGAQAGFRLAITGGALLHLNDLADSSLEGTATADQQAAQLRLDIASDELPDLEPYIDVSFGYLF